MLHAIKMSITRIWWQDLKKKKRIASICLIAGFVLMVIGLASSKSSYWSYITAVGLILFALFYVLALSIVHWIKELPEYKAQKEKERVDKILDEADKILKEFEFIGNDKVEKLRELIVSCADEAHLGAVEKLKTWLANYKDMKIKKDYLMELRQTKTYAEKKLSTDIKTTEKQIEELCVLLK